MTEILFVLCVQGRYTQCTRNTGLLTSRAHREMNTKLPWGSKSFALSNFQYTLTCFLPKLLFPEMMIIIARKTNKLLLMGAYLDKETNKTNSLYLGIVITNSKTNNVDFYKGVRWTSELPWKDRKPGRSKKMLLRIWLRIKQSKTDTFCGWISRKKDNYKNRLCMGSRKGLWVKQGEGN